MKSSSLVAMLILAACGGPGLVERYTKADMSRRQDDYAACMYDSQKAAASLDSNGTGHLMRVMNLNDLCMQRKGYGVAS